MNVHAFSTSILNVSNEFLAVAEATARLQELLNSDIDFVNVDTYSGGDSEGIDIQFQARLSDEQITTLEESEYYEYYGTI